VNFVRSAAGSFAVLDVSRKPHRSAEEGPEKVIVEPKALTRPARNDRRGT
jgi:hypothetical protein